MTKQTTGTYREGDTVEVAIDFVDSFICFRVNNNEITRVDIPSTIDHVYTSVSSEAGEIEIEVKYVSGRSKLYYSESLSQSLVRQSI